MTNLLTKQLTLTALAATMATLMPLAALADDVVNLKTTESGLHEVSYAALAAGGADINGQSVDDLVLMNQGSPVAIHVIGSDTDPDVFGAGASIRFIAKTVDTLYSDTNVYTLTLGSGQVPMGSDPQTLPTGPAATSYLSTETYEPQLNYSFTSPDQQDPWHGERLVALGAKPTTENVTMDLKDMAPGGNSGSTKAKLSVNVWGASNIPGPNNDHHVQVRFNGQEVVSSRFDGLKSEQMEVELETLRDGANQVQLRLPADTGYAFDAVNLNKVEVAYPRKFRAIDDRLSFSSTYNKFIIPGFAPTGVDGAGRPEAEILVVREDENGVSIIENAQARCRDTCRISVPGAGKLANYHVATTDSMHPAVVDALPIEQDIDSGEAKYLIISHPDFIGSDGNNRLEALAAELTSELGSADVVDVEAIYAQYGHHLFDPQSIRDYIKQSAKPTSQGGRGTEYILLVGGDVYDYRQFETQDATSFIPSIYAATGNNVTFAPVDAKYADLDDDNVPDLAIARLPVRTTSQLEILLNKRTQYLAKTYGGKALLVADDYDDIQQYSFSDDADEIEADYLTPSNGWTDIEKAYVDDLGVRAARTKVVSEINGGTSLTAFFGHSSTNQWSFNGLFTGPDAAGLSNQGKPTVVTQWGCWNAYYVSPSEDSMGHRFMMEGDRGAVAVMGASTLTNADSERRLARLVFERLANGERLGDAVTNAKQEYAQTSPGDLDVLLGWTVLGLPELFIN